jgi:thiamine-phosphate pyrophosphorylase
MTKTPLQGLYAITPAAPLPIATLVDQVGAAIAGGARVIQYRDKTHPR